MEKQEKLFLERRESEDLFQGRKPEVQVNVNNYLAAGAMIREMIIKKTWIIPVSKTA